MRLFNDSTSFSLKKLAPFVLVFCFILLVLVLIYIEFNYVRNEIQRVFVIMAKFRSIHFLCFKHLIMCWSTLSVCRSLFITMRSPFSTPRNLSNRKNRSSTVFLWFIITNDDSGQWTNDVPPYLLFCFPCTQSITLTIPCIDTILLQHLAFYRESYESCIYVNCPCENL